MKLFAIRFAIAAALVGLTYTVLAGGNNTPLALEPSWETDLDAAKARAEAESKLIVADVYADWCKACREMWRDTYPDPNVRTLTDSFVVLKVHADTQPDAAFQLSGGITPTTVVLTPGGDPLVTSRGYRDAESYAAMLTEARSIYQQQGQTEN
jgi:thiol:disulfide interchange protein